MKSRECKKKLHKYRRDVALCFPPPRFTPQKTNENRGSRVNIGSEVLKISLSHKSPH